MSSAQQVSDTKSTSASAGTPTTRLDILALDKLTITYFTKGLAASTQKSFEGAQNRLLTFCSETGLWPVLPSEKVLLFCSILSLKTSYLKAYLSAVRYLHIAEEASELFNPGLHHLQYIFCGIKRCEAEQGNSNRERLPITPDSTDPDKITL